MMNTLAVLAISLAPVFSDHAVLQRGKNVPVWGYGAKAGEFLTLTLGDVKSNALAAPDGTFSFLLPAQSAGGPYELIVSGSSGAGVKAVDVYFGEVWLASGQSNMARHMRDVRPQLKGDHPLVRQFLVRRGASDRPLAFGGGEWYRAEHGATKNFSAVGAFFAERISRELGGVAVGILNASEGGTSIQQWSSREALADSENGRRSLAHADRLRMNHERLEKMPRPVRDTGIAPASADWMKSSFDDSRWTKVLLPNDYQNAFRRGRFNGAAWFRRKVKIPADWKGRLLELGVGQIDKSDMTWVDGKLVGALGSDDDPTHYDTPRIYHFTTEADEVTLAVRCWSYAAGAGVYGDVKEMYLRVAEAPAESVSLAGEWRGAVERDIGALDCPDIPALAATLYNAMIAPLVPYAIRGILWYQGCSNGGEGGRAYRAMQNAMVRDLRRRWCDTHLPFACVQLAGIGKKKSYDRRGPGIRFHQMLSTLDLGHAGCVSAVDVGDEKDIHPLDKKTVGERMAGWALVEAYGRKGAGMGPRYRSCEMKDGKIFVDFTDKGAGLVAKGSSEGSVGGVYVAGADKKFVAAEAKIEGGRLVAGAASVAKPEFIRYAWSSFPSNANLYNVEGYPASCFTNEEDE